jgi:GAF domain
MAMGDSVYDDLGRDRSPTQDGDGRVQPVSAAPHPGRAAGDSLFAGIGAICDTATRLTGVDGAAVAILAPSKGVRELVYATDAMAQKIDEMQFTLSEGPCLDAYQENRPQLCAWLEDATFLQQWPAFTAEVVEFGVVALFAYPVPGEQRPMGVLELYRRSGGQLSKHEQNSALLCASAVRTALESNWHDHLLRSGSEQAALDAVAISGTATAEAEPFTRTEVYVASGMLAVQLQVPTGDALARLRAYAYANHRPITAVAADVVARRLSSRQINDDDEPSADS